MASADYTGRDQRLKYLFQNGGGGGGGSCKVISGYYHNGDFYVDQSYTQVITGDTECLYIDLDTTTLYLFDGTDYVEVQGGLDGLGDAVLLWSGDFVGSGDITVNGISEWLVVAFGNYDTGEYLTIGTPYRGGLNFGTYQTYSISQSAHRFSLNGDVLSVSAQNRGIYFNNSTTYDSGSDCHIKRIYGLVKKPEYARGNNHTYSTTEQVVGTWIDGKPIYEVTFTQITPNIASGSMIELADLSSLAIDNVVSITGGVWYETGTAADKRYLSLGDYCGIEYGDSTGKAYGRQSFTSATTNRTWTWNGTIRYTKTTD